MNNVYNEPKYDTDLTNKGYVDKTVDNAINGVEDDINEVDGKVATKSKNFGSQPTPPYRVNDTWMNGTDIYICNNERLIGNFVASDWQKASTYDNTKSILDGGVTTDGTLVVVKGGTVSAGLTAYTSGDNGVRIWAGSDINGINSAPFRVTQKGYLYASNAEIAGTIIATGGTIGGWTVGNKRLYSGSGNTYVRLDSNADVGSAIWCGAESATNAPFRVTKAGYLYASNANISGTITSNNANITGGSIKVHGTASQSLIKAYVDGYENSAFTELTPSYFRWVDNNSNGSCWLGAFGDPTLQITKGSSTNFESVTIVPNLITVLKQQGSSQTISNIAPDKIETPKIIAGNIDCGTCALNSASDKTIVFNKTFSSVPIVVLTCTQNNTPNNTVYAGSVIATTKTGFTAFCMTNANSARNISFNWIAIGA